MAKEGGGMNKTMKRVGLILIVLVIVFSVGCAKEPEEDVELLQRQPRKHPKRSAECERDADKSKAR